MYGRHYPIILIDGRWQHESRSEFIYQMGWPWEQRGDRYDPPRIIGVTLWTRGGRRDYPVTDLRVIHRDGRRTIYDFHPRPDVNVAPSYYRPAFMMGGGVRWYQSEPFDMAPITRRVR